MSSEFFATRATGLSCNPNSSGKQSTLVKKEIEFLHANLCEVRVDSDYGYEFLDGTEERKEDLTGSARGGSGIPIYPKKNRQNTPKYPKFLQIYPKIIKIFPIR